MQAGLRSQADSRAIQWDREQIYRGNVQFGIAHVEFDIPVIHAQLSIGDLELKEGGGVSQLEIYTWQP